MSQRVFKKLRRNMPTARIEPPTCRLFKRDATPFVLQAVNDFANDSAHHEQLQEK